MPLLLAIALLVSITSLVSAQTGQASCANDGAVTDTAGNPELVADCAALLAARDTLAGSATLNWSADLAVEDWGRRNAGRLTKLGVTGLYLRAGHLSGTIPVELGSLTNLSSLDLSGQPVDRGNTHRTG